jgi:hypothetical protein
MRTVLVLADQKAALFQQVFSDSLPAGGVFTTAMVNAISQGTAVDPPCVQRADWRSYEWSMYGHVVWR